jgi:autotransporter-associated beta strand protein
MDGHSNNSSIVAFCVLKRVLFFFAVAIFAWAGAMPHRLFGAPLYWDTSTASGLQPGTGNWSTMGMGTNLRWSSTTGGSSPLLNWANGSDAFFETSGTSPVTVNNLSMTVNSLTFDGTGYTIGPGNGSLSLTGSHTITTNADATISAGLAGTVGLIKLGSSILTLSGSNSFTGLTDVQAGTIAYGANDVLANASTVRVSGGTLDIKTFTDTVAGVQLTSGSITGTTGVLTSTSAFDRQAGSVTAKLGGSVGLTKTTAGSVTLSGANTYSGATNINAGTLSAAATNSLGGTSSVTVSSGGTLLLSGATGNNRINDSAGVSMTGGSTFNTGKLTEGVVPTGPTGSGESAGMAALTLSGSSAAPGDHIVINFATLSTDPGSALAFSNLIGGSGKFVDLLNWTGNLGFDTGASNNDRLLFANDPGLSQTDLANWNFYSDGGSTLFAAGGTEFVYGNMIEIVAVPEPSTWAAAGLSLLTIAYSQRRRVIRAVKRVRLLSHGIADCPPTDFNGDGYEAFHYFLRNHLR